jgi:hypothetical protein
LFYFFKAIPKKTKRDLVLLSDFRKYDKYVKIKVLLFFKRKDKEKMESDINDQRFNDLFQTSLEEIKAIIKVPSFSNGEVNEQ